MKKTLIVISIIVIIITVAAILFVKVYLPWENSTFSVTEYTVSNEKIPSEFDGYKIMLISDLHGTVFDENNKPLSDAINSANADMVAFAGDMIDEGIPNSTEVWENLIKDCNLPKDTYIVTGNHDMWSNKINRVLDDIKSKFKIDCLHNESVNIYKNGASITLSGIDDPSTWDNKVAADKLYNAVDNLDVGSGYNIMLYHRANMLDCFNDMQFDLVLSGHMHGGQIRIPFLGGLKSPHGDWFPDYAGGIYEKDTRTYIVSRGLGNAVKIPRIFNRGELVLITLKSK